MIKISEEQRAALKQNPQGVSCEDADSARTYFLVEESVHLRAMQALKHQQDLEAIRRGVAQMDAGKGTPVEEVRQQLARELGFSVSGS
jgi:predicted transcriptional regulator